MSMYASSLINKEIWGIKIILSKFPHIEKTFDDGHLLKFIILIYYSSHTPDNIYILEIWIPKFY